MQDITHWELLVFVVLVIAIAGATFLWLHLCLRRRVKNIEETQEGMVDFVEYLGALDEKNQRWKEKCGQLEKMSKSRVDRQNVS